MGRKTEHERRKGRTPVVETDTATYEQPQGTTDRDATAKRLPRTPHERDESAGASGDRLKQDHPPSKDEISQAHEDIERGLVDTDRRGIPDDVPSSRRNREK